MVQIFCRASFALSFSLVPPTIAPVDDQTTQGSSEDILANGDLSDRPV